MNPQKRTRHWRPIKSQTKPYITFNKWKNCHMRRNIQLKFLNLFSKELILKRSSQIHYYYKPIYVSKGLAGGFPGKEPSTCVYCLVTLVKMEV